MFRLGTRTGQGCCYSNGTGPYLSTLVERKTKLLLMSQLANKQADTVRRAIIRLLKPYKWWVHTITADNGAECAKHEEFAKQLGAAVYFADPYASW
ncbi:MAG: IS30 family transposase, partial [Bacteroidota bacterium]|nr:IS30 family transposase [Bacteroidota bacterium]